MPTLVDKVCDECGKQFSVTAMRRKQKTCSAECRSLQRSKTSSRLMKHRRNGGDPALNAKLAKGCGDHLRRMWQKPEFLVKHQTLGAKKLAAYMADAARRKSRDETNRARMGGAARRLRKDPGFTEIMSKKVREYMGQEPFSPVQHGSYVPDYLSMILSRVNNDAEVRAFCDARMSEYLRGGPRNARRTENGSR